MQMNLNYGSQIINYSVSFSPRKTFSITVYPDLRVEVRAPLNSEEKIKERVKKKAPWILHQLDYFQSFLPRTPERKYVSGESFRYLGKQYQLKLIKANEESVKVHMGMLTIKSFDIGKIRVKQILTSWYYKHAREKILGRFKLILPKFKKYGLEVKEVRFKKMETRWGSCNVRQAIILNPELIKASTRCIDYVITHELCHLKHPNHSAKFYQMLDIMMPDWEKWKQKLEESMV